MFTQKTKESHSDAPVKARSKGPLKSRNGDLLDKQQHGITAQLKNRSTTRVDHITVTDNQAWQMKSSSHYLGIFELDQNLVHPGLMFSDLPLKVQKQLKIDYETQLHPKATANDPWRVEEFVNVRLHDRVTDILNEVSAP
jgi:hypothetical protein